MIEQVSVKTTLPDGQEPRDTFIGTRAGGSSFVYHRLMKQEARQDGGYFTLSQDVTLYADPGTTVTCT